MNLPRLLLSVWLFLSLVCLLGKAQAAAPSLAPHTFTPHLEFITRDAATGDGGNIWGGHQTRIVRTADGVFAAYTVAGRGYKSKVWRLARRTKRGKWKVIATGVAGREPVNLLASAAGTLSVIGFPKGRGKLWQGKPAGNKIQMTVQTIPDVPRGFWQYSAAGMGADRTLCAVSSDGSDPGQFYVFCLDTNGDWSTRTFETDYRYAYTYVFPQANGALSLVNTRDVTWETLGYTHPPDTFDYVFNALGYWHTENVANASLDARDFIEEPPSEDYPAPVLNAQTDAYLDTHGQMHILYTRYGESTNGEWQYRHRNVDDDGTVIADVQLPSDAEWYNRIFQDASENFYILSSSGRLYPAGADGLTMGAPLVLDLQGHSVEYSGFGVSVPRTGTGLSDKIEIVFPSGNEKDWIYFRLDLAELFGQEDK